MKFISEKTVFRWLTTRFRVEFEKCSSWKKEALPLPGGPPSLLQNSATRLEVVVLRVEVGQRVRRESDLALQGLDDLTDTTARVSVGAVGLVQHRQLLGRDVGELCQRRGAERCLLHGRGQRRETVGTDVEARTGDEQRLTRRVVVRRVDPAGAPEADAPRGDVANAVTDHLVEGLAERLGVDADGLPFRHLGGHLNLELGNAAAVLHRHGEYVTLLDARTAVTRSRTGRGTRSVAAAEVPAVARQKC